MILSIDPGRNKCGFAILKDDLTVVEKGIIASEDIPKLFSLIINYSINTVILGSGTGHKEIADKISNMNQQINIVYMPEYNSTLEAKARYFIENPPKGFWRFIPKTLQVPQRPIDDYAAVILAERHLKR